MRIYTRTGDRGETSLLGPLRVPKNNIRIAAYGDVDELNAEIGFLRRAITDPAQDSILGETQRVLFEAGAELASPAGSPRHAGAVREEDVVKLEAAIDGMTAGLQPLTQFLLPGGGEAASRAHIARCVCRRAERAVVGLLLEEPGETGVIRYLNRLSDYLFVLARWENQKSGVAEPTWTSRGAASV